MRKTMLIYVAGAVPEPAPTLLAGPGREVRICRKEEGPDRTELLENIRDADGVMTLLSCRVDAEAMAAAKKLRVISNYAVGFDNVDVEEATRRGIVVTNTPGVLTDATAELAIALLFAAARRIPESERFLRAGRFRGWGPNLMKGVLITGKTLGLAGAGRIGQAVGARGRALGMNVVYFDEEARPEFERLTGAERVDKAGLLARSDFLSLHLPLTPGTKHFLEYEDLRRMKRDAVVINTSRGPVIDEEGLALALKERVIMSAALDVYEREPEVDPRLLALENVVLAPHIGSATVETRARMAEIAARNLLDVLERRMPMHPVNPQACAGFSGRAATGTV